MMIFSVDWNIFLFCFVFWIGEGVECIFGITDYSLANSPVIWKRCFLHMTYRSTDL